MSAGDRRTAGAGLRAGARSALVAATLFLAAAALSAAPLAGAGPSPASNPAPTAAERLTVRATGDLLIPILGDELFFGLGNRAGAALEYRLFDFLSLSARAGTGSVAIGGLAHLALGDAGLGLALELKPLPRWLLRLEGSGGIFNAKWGSLPASGLGLSARGELGFRLSPALTLSLGGGYSWYGGPGGALLNAANAGLVLTVKPSALGSSTTRVFVETAALEPVFPVFHGYYDENPFGSLRVTNGEEGEITDVHVSFVSSRYMARPKELGGAAKLAPGASVEIPLRALFSEEVLAATESSLLPSEAIVEYRLVGSKREVRHPIDLRLYHRNAMNWDDDRRAAAFVSPKDPAVLWFARFGQGIARDRLRGGVDPNLQYAASLFEALRLFGVNYVVDPSSSYVEKSASGSSVDYLQYPYQTLAYRGGDCDDLSILFCSLLSSLGVETAFITIPGHIYMAFALSLSGEEARDAFYDQGLVIREGGKVWLPVEITMVKDGFAKAWRVGAKEWADNARQGQAKLYPLAEAWRLYPSVGIPDVNPRFSLPDSAAAMQAFDMAMDRYVAREIEQRVKTLVAGAAPGPARDNELGILYGRSGMLKESWRELSKAAKEGFEPAWVNLGNVAFIRKDYELSLTYYEWARKLEPSDALAALGLARSYYELERFDASDREYERLRSLDPGLAAKFGYLASTYGGEGRAWSLADRLSSTRWAIPAPVPAVAKAPAPAPSPVPAPASPVEAAPSYSAPPSPSQEGFMGVAAARPSEAPASSAAAAPQVDTAPVAIAAAEPNPEPGAEAAAAPVIVDEPEPAAVAAATTPADPAAQVGPVSTPGFSLLLNPPQVPAAATPAATPAAAPTIAEALPEDRELEEQRAAAAREVEAAAIAKLANEAAAARAEAEAAALREAEMAARAKLKAEADAEAARLAQEAERRAAEAERLAAEKRAAEATRAAAEKLAAEKQAAETAEAERLAAEKLAAERQAAETALAEAPAAAETETQAEVIAVVEAAGPAEPTAEAVSAEAMPEMAASPLEAAPAEPVREVALAEPEAAAPLVAAPETMPEAPSAAPEDKLVAEAAPAAETAPEPSAVAEAPAAESAPVAEAPPSEPETGVGESDLPASVAQPLAAGFVAFRRELGDWTIGEEFASQNDPESYFAKLALPLKIGGALRYSFSARSIGKGWVGFGIHVLVAKVGTHRGYGEGSSTLVWLSRDPRGGDPATRLQIYRSRNDVDMSIVDEAATDISALERNRFEIDVDPSAGLLVVRVNDREAYRKTGLFLEPLGDYVVLRALDRAEFSDFSVEALP